MLIFFQSKYQYSGTEILKTRFYVTLIRSIFTWQSFSIIDHINHIYLLDVAQNHSLWKTKTEKFIGYHSYLIWLHRNSNSFSITNIRKCKFIVIRKWNARLINKNDNNIRIILIWMYDYSNINSIVTTTEYIPNLVQIIIKIELW